MAGLAVCCIWSIVRLIACRFLVNNCVCLDNDGSGDREVDVAMADLFGGFSSDFYKGYEDEWPLPEGHERRKTIYNLYHILNHDVLFGGGYIRQAKSMIEEILRY